MELHKAQKKEQYSPLILQYCWFVLYIVVLLYWGEERADFFFLVLLVLVYSFFFHILFSPFCAGMQFDHDFLVIIAVAITFQFCFNNIIICNQKNVVND